MLQKYYFCTYYCCKQTEAFIYGTQVKLYIKSSSIFCRFLDIREMIITNIYLTVELHLKILRFSLLLCSFNMFTSVFCFFFPHFSSLLVAYEDEFLLVFLFLRCLQQTLWKISSNLFIGLILFLRL